MRPRPARPGVSSGFRRRRRGAKLGVALFTGFDDDEAYTLVISRALALSYFDHPPLHQWLLHGFVRLSGEGHWDRLPFWAMNVATNLPLYGLDAPAVWPRRGAVGALRFQRQRLFLVLPDGYIMPDAPLLLALPAASGRSPKSSLSRADAAPGTLAVARGRRRASGSPACPNIRRRSPRSGSLGFFLGSPKHRRWLRDARPYRGAALALAMFSPALIWNAEQRLGFARLPVRPRRRRARASRRAAPVHSGGARRADRFAVAVDRRARRCRPMARGGARDATAARGSCCGWRCRRSLLFALLPLVGQRSIPHWFDSGWLFAFPLAGAWLAGLGDASARSAGRSVHRGSPRRDASCCSSPSVMFGPARRAARRCAGIPRSDRHFLRLAERCGDAWGSGARRAAGLRVGRKLARRRPRRRRPGAACRSAVLAPIRAGSPSPAIRRRLSAAMR